jgi:heterodisulfide reductase subunit B
MTASDKNSRFLLFLGCAIPYRVSSYEISTRKVLGKLGIELVEMPEYNCCGLPIDPVNHEMMISLAARNLCLAEQKGLSIVALCPGCAGTLRKVNKKLKEDKKLREKISGYLDHEFKGTIEAKHLLQLLNEDVGLQKIKDSIKRPLTGLQASEHSGCHVNRPYKDVEFDDPENPKVLRSLIEATGARYLDYTDRLECCGAPVAGINDRIPLQLTREKLVHVKEAGAKALITVCPFCHMMFDTNQPRIERMFGENLKIPVLHYPQLLGLAMGLAPKELGLEDLRVSADHLFPKIYGRTEASEK